MSYDRDPRIVLSKADFTADGSCTLTDTEGGINLVHASNGSAHSIYGMYKAAPGGAYTLTAHYVPNGENPASGLAYNGLYVSDGTKYQSFGPAPNNSAGGKMDLILINYTNNTSGSGGGSYTQTMFGDMWLRLADDTVNRTWSISKDGRTFTQVFQVVRTNFLTPTRIGFCANAYSAAVNVTFDSWLVQ